MGVDLWVGATCQFGWPIRYLFVYLFIYLGICLSKLLNYLFSALWLLVKKKKNAISNRDQAELAERHPGLHPSRAELVPQFTFYTIPANPFVLSGLFLLKSLVKSIPQLRGVWLVFVVVFCGDF